MARTLATLGAPGARAGGQFFNWYDPATGARLTTWPADGSPLVPFLSAVDNGWLAAGADDGGERRARAAREGPRARGGDGLRLLLRPGRRASCAAGRGPSSRRAAATRQGDVWFTKQPLRRPELRAADGQLPGHRRRARCRPSTTSTSTAPSRRVRRRRLPGDAAQRRDAHLPRRRRLRGPLRLPRHAHRPHLGRRHVRGADGPALRARGALGPALVGRQPPALRARADRARPRRGALRLLGLLAQRQPVGRLQRLRRRRHRHAGRRLPLQQRQHVRRPRLRRLPARRSPTRRRRPTPTASSPRTPRSWPCATRRGRRSRTSRKLRSHFGVYGKGGFYDAVNVGPDTAARSPAPTSRSTRAWSWPRRPTR